VAQVRTVFRIFDKVVPKLFGFNVAPPKHLAYVEWFTPFAPDPDADYHMYKITRGMKDGKRISSVIPVSHISRSAHLFPVWGGLVPRDWTKETIL
jgi:hypothetical protein